MSFSWWCDDGRHGKISTAMSFWRQTAAVDTSAYHIWSKSFPVAQWWIVAQESKSGFVSYPCQSVTTSSRIGVHESASGFVSKSHRPLWLRDHPLAYRSQHQDSSVSLVFPVTTWFLDWHTGVSIRICQFSSSLPVTTWSSIGIQEPASGFVS